jgi:cysteinyl-tRNA synthetase
MRDFKRKTKGIARKTDQKSEVDRDLLERVKGVFKKEMDDDLNPGKAFDKLCELIEEIDLKMLKPKTAYGLTKGLREIDEVLRILF